MLSWKLRRSPLWLLLACILPDPFLVFLWKLHFKGSLAPGFLVDLVTGRQLWKILGKANGRKENESNKKEIRCISHHFSLHLAGALSNFSNWPNPPFVSLAPEGLPCFGSSSIQNSVGVFIFSVCTPYSRMVASSITNFWAAIPIYCYNPQTFHHPIELISWIKFPWLEIPDLICIS